MALVTTLGGLVIAIPAMIVAQYFESRIISLFHELDEILFDLIPGFEHYEGKLRARQRTYEGSSGGGSTTVSNPIGGETLDPSQTQPLPRTP